MSRKINAAGLLIIQQSEGCELAAYPDPGTHGAPWTVGFGHTGPDVYPGLTITQAEAGALLAQDLAHFEEGVTNLAPVCTDNQFAALVSFAYNLGLGTLRTSTLLRLHNAGNYTGAAGQFSLWVHAEGRTLPGLITRRAAEAALYRKDDQ